MKDKATLISIIIVVGLVIGGIFMLLPKEDNFKTSFMDGCNGGTATQKQCECAYKDLTERYSMDEIKDITKRYVETDVLPTEIIGSALRCLQKGVDGMTNEQLAVYLNTIHDNLDIAYDLAFSALEDDERYSELRKPIIGLPYSHVSILDGFNELKFQIKESIEVLRGDKKDV